MLVAPVNKIEKYEERILEFKGLNKKPMIEDGEMSDMLNLSSDRYPCLYPCRKRYLQDIETIVLDRDSTIGTTWLGYNFAIISALSIRDWIGDKADEIAAIIEAYDLDLGIHKYEFAYRGKIYTELSALAISVGTTLKNESMVHINSKICFFPSGLYFNLGVTDSDVSNGASRVGKLYYKTELTGGGDFAIDRDKGWLRILIGIGNMSGLKKGDVVKVTGHFAFREQGTTIGGITYCDGGGEMLDESIKNPAYPVVLGVGYSPEDESTPEYIYLELTAFDITEPTYVGGFTTGNIVVSRDVPELNFVYEHDNRLWGCSNKTNTIYACMLGDPTNWEYYQGTGMDSYYAEQGSNGYWTGIAYYNNHMVFFKENYIVKMYGTTPSTYQFNTIEAPGVKADSPKSLVSVNGVLIYNSLYGFMAYEGDYPYKVSAKIFDEIIPKGVVSGCYNNKYYASVGANSTTGIDPGLYVLDLDNACWHREKHTNTACFLTHKNVFYSMAFGELTILVSESLLARATPINIGGWYAVLGPFTEFIEDHKIYSKLDMRIKKAEGASVKFHIKVDEGEWEELASGISSTDLCYHQVIVPRRCHEFSVKISGTGDVRIDSLRRKYRKGTEGDL